MNVFSFIQIIIPVCWLQVSVESRVVSTFSELPAADNFFHIYALPVGQGDSFVLQCPAPGGQVSIFDMGSTDFSNGGVLWSSKEVRTFLSKSFHRIENILVTHNHLDHYNYLKNVFTSASSVRSIKKIHISCKKDDLNTELQKWVEKFNMTHKLTTHNNGLQCGPNNVSCGFVDLCPNSRLKIEAKVMIANWGQQCRKDNSSKSLQKNTDSQAVMLKVGSVKVLLNGDFEDFTPSPSENGPLKALVNYYGSDLNSHVYHLSHHGASYLANKDFLLAAVKPKAIFVSSNPYGKFSHPRCLAVDPLIKNSTLCKPLAKPGNRFYCGPHPVDNSNIGNKNDKKLQKQYTCGEESVDNEKVLRNVTNNQYAIYTTVPDAERMNLIEFRTDGYVWGLSNNFMKKCSSNQKRSRSC